MNTNNITTFLYACFPIHFPIVFQKLRIKGHNDCASPDPEECFGQSPLMDDHFSKLGEERALMYKRSGVSTTRCPVLCWFLSLCWCSLQALNKKEHRGCDSPDPDASYVLTPHTEEKYKKINEEFDNMMRNHKIVSTVNAPFFAWLLRHKRNFTLFFVSLFVLFFCTLRISVTIFLNFPTSVSLRRECSRFFSNFNSSAAHFWHTLIRSHCSDTGWHTGSWPLQQQKQLFRFSLEFSLSSLFSIISS